MRRETFQFLDLVRFILEVWRYIQHIPSNINTVFGFFIFLWFCVYPHLSRLFHWYCALSYDYTSASRVTQKGKCKFDPFKTKIKHNETQTVCMLRALSILVGYFQCYCQIPNLIWMMCDKSKSISSRLSRLIWVRDIRMVPIVKWYRGLDLIG